MKNLIIIAILTVCSNANYAFSQTKRQDAVVTEPEQKSDYRNLLYTESNDIYSKVDKYPEFIGGFTALQDFFKRNLKTGGESGRVIATFVIEKDGSVSNVTVIRSFSERASAEAARVINSMPKWKPGMDNGKIVRTRFTIPVSFQKLVK